MDLERMMQFIVEQQAALAAGLAAEREERLARQVQFEEQQKEHDSRISRLERAMVDIVDISRALANRQDGLKEEMAQLHEEVAHTTANVNALVKIVDGIIRREK